MWRRTGRSRPWWWTKRRSRWSRAERRRTTSRAEGRWTAPWSSKFNLPNGGSQSGPVSPIDATSTLLGSIDKFINSISVFAHSNPTEIRTFCKSRFARMHVWIRHRTALNPYNSCSCQDTGSEAKNQRADQVADGSNSLSSTCFGQFSH